MTLQSTNSAKPSKCRQLFPQLLVVLALLALSTFAMSDETTSPDDHSDKASSANSHAKTLGGRQLWGDVRFFQGWRIQYNVVTKHYRLLDENDNRYSSGTLQKCQGRLQQLIEERKLPPMSGKAVVMIHGIGRSSKSFSEMSSQLKSKGYTVVGFDYPSTQVSIPDCAEYLHQVVQSLDGIESIDFVCHSMGGLVLRAYSMNHTTVRFRRAVMLGVPNRGAKMADFLKENPIFKMVLGPAGQQLASDDDGGLIKKLPIPKFEFGVLAGGRSKAKGFNPLLPGDNDLTVSVSSTRLPGAADFILIPVMHSFLMTDNRGIKATLNFLEHGQFDPNVPRKPIRADDVSVIE